MSADAPGGIFRVIDLPTEMAPHVRVDRVIKAKSLDAQRHRQDDARHALATAAETLEHARAKADALIQAATAEAENVRLSRLVDIESEIAAQLTVVAEHLGDAVATCVESIYRSIFHSDPGLLIKATVEIARDALGEQLGSVLQTSIADREDIAIKALEDRFSIQASHGLPSGVLRIRGENGDLHIDASKLITELGHDLRLWFRQPGQTGQSDQGNT